MNLEDQDAVTITEAGAPEHLADGILWHIEATEAEVRAALLESSQWQSGPGQWLLYRPGVAALSLSDYVEGAYVWCFQEKPVATGTLLMWVFVVENGQLNPSAANTPERSSLAAQAIAQIQGVLKQKNWTITVQS